MTEEERQLDGHLQMAQEALDDCDKLPERVWLNFCNSLWYMRRELEGVADRDTGCRE